jgi:uncharacterized protein YbjQ (UPF0145 family)
MLNKHILVTTTSILEGWEIQQYLKPVSSHLVIGTNLFSDFFASLTDVFGGRSETYQRQISILYNDATEQLKEKAFELGANCIIGLSVDMDEISGKGKSMFMINATGTAVIAKKLTHSQNVPNSNGRIENVSYETLNTLRKRKTFLEKAKTDQLQLNDDTWSFIIENKMDEAFPYILSKWREAAQYSAESELKFRPKLVQYIASLPEAKRYELIYNTLVTEKNETILNGLTYIIKELQLVDYNMIRSYLTCGDFEHQKRILMALLYDKSFYCKEDLKMMEELIQLVNTTFQEKGQRSFKKTVFSSKEKEVWTCECGKQNEIDYRCSGCDKDIYGFKITETTHKQAIASLKQKIELVSEILNEPVWAEGQP